MEGEEKEGSQRKGKEKKEISEGIDPLVVYKIARYFSLAFITFI